MSDELIKSSQNAILEQYELMGVTKVIFSAVLDSKTCEKCLALNRKIMTLKQARDKIPVHPNCRCMWIPLARGQLFGAEYVPGPKHPEDIMFFV